MLPARYVRAQLQTIHNPLFRQFTKLQLGRLIYNYETRMLNVKCGEEDKPLRIALEYAKNIWKQMPEEDEG